MITSINKKPGLIERYETNYLKLSMYNIQPSGYDYKTNESSGLCILLKGNKHVAINRTEHLSCKSDQFILLPSHSSVHLYIESPTKALFLELKDDLISNMAENAATDSDISFAAMRKNRFLLGRINDNIGECLSKLMSIPLSSDKNKSLLFDLYAQELICYLLQIKGSQQIMNLGHEKPVYKAIRYINENITEPISISKLATTLNMSDTNFCNTFKRVTGVSPKEYITDLKMNQAEEMLKNKNVTEVAYDLGYESISHFIALFKKKYGITPKQFKSAGESLTILSSKAV